MKPDRLTKMRNNLNKTQQDMANYLGITRPAYTAYESGNRKPDYATLEKIADFFDTSTDYLLGRTDEPTPYNSKRKLPDMSGINYAAYGGAKRLEDLTDEEIEHLEEELEMFRALKEKRMREKEGNKD
ncbi:helix-turn-helix domain-containing protein [Paenibacillus sp. WQ 127069]|uniref:Helix-turn-helix domain-containing protein n=1 Tax=Paenibacillus baimaensis TaxID=2982185 RepID=A0ABT2UTR3_9BACL|nr:helix-turn-helix transcriptional regulator [Paenibacillus sp. WQ 127069]MCU6798033.1 helix-turn-helix domain-containing protein [Paenibacillus sp. WQ 127069]